MSINQYYPIDKGTLPLEAFQLLIGFSLAILVALLARRAGSLSKSGSFAAVFVGGITFGFGGILPAALLLTFFISSSLLSRVGGMKKREAVKAFEKGGERDHGQVLANGSLAAIFALLLFLDEDPIWLVGLTGAFSAVNADTWSTELGVLANRKPRLITTWAQVDSGTSGAITFEGSIAGIAGAALIGIVAGVGSGDLSLIPIATLAGVFGSTIDSLIGASVQAIYFCPLCEKQTERYPTHVCGGKTSPLRGWPWLSNDLVNFLASLFGALTSIGIWSIVG